MRRVLNLGLMLKAARETLPATLLLGGALLVIEMMLAYVLPTFQAQFSAQFSELPFLKDIIRAMLGTEVADQFSPDMFLAVPWVHPMVLAITWAHGIICCTRIPAGEIDRGTIDLMLSLPVSRWGVHRAETVVWLVTTAVVLGMGLLGNILGSAMVAPELRPDPNARLIVIANLYCLYLAVGAVAWLMSSLSDRRGRAVTISFILVIASFLLNYLAQFWEPADHVSFFSLLEYFRPLFAFRDGSWPVRDMTILLAITAVLWTVAGVIFARRDLATT